MRCKNSIYKISAFLFLLFSGGVNLLAQFRFPRPEFENGHIQPPTPTPEPRLLFYEYLDVGVLLFALCFATWFAIKKRSRKGILWLSVISLLYFGVFRDGCICSVGSLQNIALALFNPSYILPVTALIFFLLPLLFALFFGRVFCSSVCPLGAIQDIFVIKPIQLPVTLNRVLGMIPYLYLGFAVLFATTNSDFIICRYDPFVGFFRRDAEFAMFALGGIFLVGGIFVGRSYCRFFCPYGVILNWLSRFSKWHLTITPAECINCRLCENSCPFGAIHPSNTEDSKVNKKKGIRNLKILFLILPFLIFIGGLGTTQLHGTFAKLNTRVNLSEKIEQEKDFDKSQYSLEVKTFLSSGETIESLNKDAAEVRKDFKKGSWYLGSFFGLAFGISLIAFSIRKNRDGYEPDKGNCFSCGRCFKYCPVENKTK